MAVRSLESAQPSLKIKEVLTFNAKKLTEGSEVGRVEAPAEGPPPPSSGARSQQQDFCRGLLCKCLSVCVCVRYVHLAAPQAHLCVFLVLPK